MQSTVLSTNSRSDHTVRRLRDDITHGTLGPGALLAEAAVARQLGVSRVPVREALFTLEREGLVEFSATGRAYVKELVAQDFEELFLLRLSLEPPAARLAATRLRKDASLLIQNIEATARARTLLDVTHLDLDFHQIVLESSGHKRLVKIWKSLRSEMELWLARMHAVHQTQTRSTREMTVESHGRMLKCIQEQSPAAVERISRQHILGWRNWLPESAPNREI